MNNYRITGQVILRDASIDAPDGSNRKLMMLVGVIAVPKDMPLEGEHQYTISGVDALGIIQLQLYTPGLDVTKIAQGHTLGNLVLEPIWRC